MYVTRPLSLYLRSPDSLYLPPEGPNSGYLVLQDEESETTTCFGLCKNRYLINLPFPQNKNLTIRYTVRYSSVAHARARAGAGAGAHEHVSHDEASFIPVLNQPLSSNRYYAIKPHGSRKGEAYACSKEEDMTTCCFSQCIKDVKPRSFDPNDIYLQFEVFPYEAACSSGGRFVAKSVAPDGFPPYFLRRKGWQIYTKTPKTYELGEALGADISLRARLPEFNFPVSKQQSEGVVVGKWYCPFMFVKDGALRDQMKNSMFYEMTLEQRWENIFTCENNSYGQGNGSSVSLEVEVHREMVTVGGREAVWDENCGVDGVVWFRGGEVSLGLSFLIVERMKWEEERGGWVRGERKEVVNKREEFEGVMGGGGGGWRRFGCYVLVERFVLRRMDGSVVLTYDFKHTHHIRSKWE